MMNLDPSYYKIKSKSRRASNVFHYLRVFVEKQMGSDRWWGSTGSQWRYANIIGILYPCQADNASQPHWSKQCRYDHFLERRGFWSIWNEDEEYPNL